MYRNFYNTKDFKMGQGISKCYKKLIQSFFFGESFWLFHPLKIASSNTFPYAEKCHPSQIALTQKILSPKIYFFPDYRYTLPAFATFPCPFDAFKDFHSIPIAAF